MKFGIVNESTVVTGTEAYAIAAGARLQARDVARAWDRVLPSVTYYATLVKVPADRVVVAILDNADQAGALAYHDVTPDGRPYCSVFAKTILDAGGTALRGSLSVSGATTHELWECLGDPTCLTWDDYDGSGSQVAHELCDPVQDGSYDVATTYGPVAVTNFVLPAYFNPWSAAGPWDFLSTLPGPAPQLAHGGYAIVQSSSGEKQIFGEVPAWKQGLPHSRTEMRT